MKPSNRKIGLELEVEFTNTDSYRRGIGISLTPEQWKIPEGVEVEVGHDGSLAWGLEIRVCGPHRLLRRTLDIIEAEVTKKDGHITNRCGLHVHLNYNNKTIQSVRDFCNRLKEWERVFFALVSPDRRSNGYCVRAQRNHRSDEYDGIYITDFNLRNKKDKGSPNRYCWINTHSLEELGTVEIRLHQGTTRAFEIMHWVDLLLAFEVSAIAGSLPEFDSGKKIVTNLNRLLGRLRITKECQDWWIAQEREFRGLKGERGLEF